MQRPAASPAPPGRARWHYLLVGAVAAVVVFWRLGGAVMHDHECHLALTARVMADRRHRQWLVPGDMPYEIVPHTTLNHWMVPVENGRPRLVKTPLPYWCAAGVARLAGGVTNVTARFTSAFAAVLLVWVTLALGRRMMSPRAALFGALMLASTVGFQKWGRNARPEMLLCLLMTAAMACFYMGLAARTRGGLVAWMAAFWVCMGLGNLAKEFVPLLLAWPLAAYVFWRRSAEQRGDALALGRLKAFLVASGVGLAVHVTVTMLPALHWWRAVPVAGDKGTFLTLAVLLGAPLAWYAVATGVWRAGGRLLPTVVPGALLMGAMFLPWMGYMVRLFPELAGEVFAEQVSDRAAGVGAWSAAAPTKYLGALVTLTLPWLAFIPGALAVALVRPFARRRAGLVFLLLWSVGLVGLFVAAAAKREHYILPMIPALCLLMGFAADDVLCRNTWLPRRLGRLVGVGYGAVGVIGPPAVAVAWAVRPDQARWPAMLAVMAVAAVPLITAGLLAARDRLRPVVPLVACAFAFVYVGHAHLFPRWDPRRPVAEFAAAAARAVPQDANVWHWRDPQAKTVFYFGRQVPAIQWRFRRADPAADEDVITRRVNAYLAADPNRAPWILGYQAFSGRPSPEAVRLGELGYRVVHCRQGLQDRRYVFTLWHRPPDGAGAGAGGR
jgi:4-amino-4-deoxy-L-arabinose transferase-like glycosyltransferase